MKTLMIIGAGGHGKVVADAASSMKHWNEIVFVDKRHPDLSTTGHWPVNYNDDGLETLDKKTYDFIVAIGDNNIRHKLHSSLKERGFNIVNVIHPTAEISEYAELGVGNVILVHAVINVDVKLGDACIINTTATVDHDCIIDDGVHISPGVNLSGQVEVGERSWIGIGASVIQQVKIGAGVTVGAGSVVLSNVKDNITIAGAPARIIKHDA